ncbi:MAG: cytochrome c [Hyphomicrobiales bacterium]|nr:cytochrome c [Hyphomicrobiales bacterium]
MKGIGLRLALTTAAFALAATTQGYGAARRTGGGALEAKLEYCKTCHGLGAEGYRGYYVMPRLAGQPSGYIVNQLRAFQEKRRVNPIMSNVAHGIPPGMIGALAASLQSMNSPPFGGAPNASIALGREIFATGLPDANIPACSACHGPDAKGQNAIPRLAGQVYWYTIKALSNWSQERGLGKTKDLSAIMGPTAHNLTPTQKSAIAAYVSTLR